MPDHSALIARPLVDQPRPTGIRAADLDENLADLLGLDLADPETDELVRAVDRDMDLVDRLVQVRRDSGLTQREVAERMGCSQPNVSAFERVGGDPHLSTIRRYAVAVGARVGWRVEVVCGREAVASVPLSVTAVDDDASAYYRRATP